MAYLDGPAREVKLLADHRHDLVVERTKLVNRLRWHLHELDPALTIPSRVATASSTTSQHGWRASRGYSPASPASC